jgi:hypothetical protein
MEVSGQFHASVVSSSSKLPPVQTEQEAGWATELVETFWRRLKSEALAPNRTTISPSPSAYSSHHGDAPVILMLLLVFESCDSGFYRTWICFILINLVVFCVYHQRRKYTVQHDTLSSRNTLLHVSVRTNNHQALLNTTI